VNVALAVAEDLSGLRWADEGQPGIRRRRRGRGWSYIDDRSGARVVDEASVARLRQLAIPPAWTSVWICADPRGHLQATGRDARGRKQYRYHARYRAHREAAKFRELIVFGRSLPAIRRCVARDLARPGMPKEKVVAAAVSMLEGTLIRVGNEEYARSNKSYGLTTLRNRHARWRADGTVQFVFTAKHGKAQRVELHDKRVARILRRCRDLPGEVLLEYTTDAGEVAPVRSDDVNNYLRAAAGEDISAKVFRTWFASLLAASQLGALPAADPERTATGAITRTCEMVATQLGNTPRICRASYIHPTVIDAFSAGTLQGFWYGVAPSTPRGLVADERRLLALLEGAAATGKVGANKTTKSRTRETIAA
jgi:DNA topoisomerase-1